MAGLSTLRANPSGTVGIVSFFIEANMVTGGPVKLTDAGTKDGINTLRVAPTTANDTSPDYFYPYLAGREVGTVTVPAHAPIGTIVVTPGMNGCGLVIMAEDNGAVSFHHDPNNRHFTPAAPPLLRIEPTQYMTRGVGATLCAERSKAGDPTMMSHQLVAVKQEGFWTVLNFGILLGNSGGGSSAPVGSYQDGQSGFIVTTPGVHNATTGDEYA